MAGRSALRDVETSIIAVCQQGHAPQRLKSEVIARLRRVVAIDAVWWATSDPATLLFTQAFREGIPDRTPYFIDNEFVADDVNQWTDLARDGAGVRTLASTTGGDLQASARYRDLFEPLGLGDELRAVLRTGEACWGLMCLHRETGRPFSEAEQQLIARLAPHLGEGIRAGLLTTSITDTSIADAPIADTPGLVLLNSSGELVAAMPAAQAWFIELGHDPRTGAPVPAEVSTAAALLQPRPGDRVAASAAIVPRLRARTRSGRWVVLHASLLETVDGGASTADQIAVIIERAAPVEVATVIMHANGLTERERAVTGLVCQGRSTAQIAANLAISPNTVQDHLKAVFDKTGVRSRREVMATMLRDHYVPGLKTSQPVGGNGYFRPD